MKVLDFLCKTRLHIYYFKIKSKYYNVNSVFILFYLLFLNGHQNQKEVISMTRPTKANRALLEQNLCELNRQLAEARKEHDEESIEILEAQVNATIRELDR